MILMKLMGYAGFAPRMWRCFRDISHLCSETSATIADLSQGIAMPAIKLYCHSRILCTVDAGGRLYVWNPDSQVGRLLGCEDS